MSTITFTVGSGQTFSTWQTAITAIGANTLGNQYDVLATSGTVYSAAAPTISVAGITTSTGAGVRIGMQAGHSFDDNANKLTNQLRYNPAYGGAVTSSGGTGRTVSINNDDVTVDGLMVLDGSSGGAIQQIAGSRCVIKNCIFESDMNTSGGGTLNTYSATVVNCLSVNNGGGAGVVSNGGNSQYHEVTSVQTLTASNSGFRGNYDAPLYFGCASFGFATAFANASNASNDYNASGDTTAPGAHSIKSKTFANQFVNITNTSARDFRVKSGADLIGAGARDATFTADLDILKQTRALTNTTIGCFEFVVSGMTVTVDFGFVVDWCLARSVDGRTPSDWIAARMADARMPSDWVAPAVINMPSLIEWLGTSRVDSPVPAEWLAARLVEGRANAEWLAAVTADGRVAVEMLASVRSDAVAPSEWTGGVSVTADARMPLEWSLQIAVDAREAVDWLGLRTTDGAVPDEWLAQRSIDARAPNESLASTRYDGVEPVDWTGNLSVTVDARVPVEWSGGITVTATGVMPMDFGATVQADACVPANWSAALLRDTTFPVDFNRGLIVDQRAAVEWLRTVFGDAVIPGATLVVMVADSRVPVEFGGASAFRVGNTEVFTVDARGYVWHVDARSTIWTIPPR